MTMQWLRVLIVAGMSYCACGLLAAEELIFRAEGREHPFMQAEPTMEPHTPAQPSQVIVGLVLVGTLGPRRCH